MDHGMYGFKSVKVQSCGESVFRQMHSQSANFVDIEE